MRKLCVTFFVLFLFSAIFLSADFYIQKKTHTDAVTIMGQTQPARDIITHQWISADKMANLTEEQSFVIDMEKNVVFWINNVKKTYMEIALPMDISKYLPPQAAQMMENMSIDVSVEPTSETLTVNGKKCKRYDLTMTIMMMMTMEMKMKIWATTDVPFDWKKFQDKMVQMINPTMPLGQDAIDAFMKIEGFHMKTEMVMNMMGADMKTFDEVVEIVEKDAPPGTYTVPEGYTKQEKFSFEDMQRR
ncbi:MAG: hypothetical protein JXB23_17370 [Candidatus Aminicenantes bacterium]|nr:hypothetical protein [Candidatus Aminicenantes bacterium]